MLTRRELDTQIQNCKNCRLAGIEQNIFDLRKGYGKLLGNGGSEVMIIAQNPSVYRVPFQMSAMGVETELKWKGDFFKARLTKLGIDTSKIYWTNIVKCSTSQNIEPPGDIISECSNWVFKEIELVNPKKIVCMGRVPYNFMISSDLRMIPISYIWHYSYVERNKFKYPKYDEILKSEFAGILK